MADLKYKSYDSLLASVEEDLRSFTDNNLIVRKRYIKVARAINAELGIKINEQKEEEIEVENFKAFLPEDCLSIQSAIALVSRKDCEEEDREQNNFNQDIHYRDTRTRWYLLMPSRRSLSLFSKKSLNRHHNHSRYQIDVDESEMSFNFEEGRVMLHYVSDLVDEDGGLLVLDHPIVNGYYEAAIRAAILKDLWYNSDADTFNKYQNENERVLPLLRQKANQIVDFPGYKALKQYNDRVNRDFYNKYMRMII